MYDSLAVRWFFSVASVLVVLYVWYSIKFRKFIKCAKTLPGDDSYPIIGNLIEGWLYFRNRKPEDYTNYFLEKCMKYKHYGLMKYLFGPYLMVIIWDSKYVKEIVSNPNTIRKGKLFQYIMGQDALQGAFINEGDEEWRSLNKPLYKSMQKKYLEGNHYQVMLRQTKAFVDHLKGLQEKRIENFYHEIMALQMNTFFESHVGKQDFTKVIPTLLQIADRYILERMKQIVNVWPFILNHIRTPYREDLQYIRNTSQYVIDKRREDQSKEVHADGYEYYSDYLLKRGEERGFDDPRIGREMVDALVAGSDTISGVLSSLIVFIAVNPELQEELYKEQVSVLGQDVSKELDMEDIPKMELLDRAIKETLRLVNVPFFHKQATADLQLGEYEIPEDAYLVVFIYGLHRNPDYWERPHDFHPDHFLPEQVKARPDFAYVPFGIGIRRCPGESYARLSVATTASYLIRNFKFLSKWRMKDIEYESILTTHLHKKMYKLDFTIRH